MMAKKKTPTTPGEAQAPQLHLVPDEAEVLADAAALAQVLQFSDFASRPRRPKKPEPEVALPVLDDAMRNLHAAAHAALKLIFLARHRLGLPQL